MSQKKITLKNCLKLLPLRIAITDYCNLGCFFCSNEGMSLWQKNKTHINVDKFKYLINELAKAGLKNISITGGEPTIHPEITEIINFLRKFNFKNLFLHTNGINLNKEILKKLSGNFNKVAVSIHSVKFDTWQKITGGTKEQFKKIIDNLRILSKFTNHLLVEVKYVPLRGYNYSEKELRNFIELCNDFAFKFKILNFEPIIPRHLKLKIPFSEIERCLINIGCQADKNEKQFRGQSKYLPIKKFRYKKTQGVAIKIGCGNPKVCQECYKCNEIFITPEFKIKPCHMHNYQVDLNDFIKQKDKQAIFKAIADSRLFLAQAPGTGGKVWQHNY